MLSPILMYNELNKTTTDPSSMIDQFIQKAPSLPRYAEGGYSPLGRSPVVDTLLVDPFYMPIYAETVAKLIKSHSKENQLFSLSSSLFRAAGIPIADLAQAEVLQPVDDEIPEQFLTSFPPTIAKKLYSYWLTFMQIHQEVEKILGVLSEEEKAWIRDNYNGFFFGKQESEIDYDFFTSDNPYPLHFFDLASRIDLAKLADCARKLSVISDDFYQSRQAFTRLLLNDDFIWEEGELKLMVSQKTHGEHEESADFFIDLGGHNSFHNNAGGTEGTRSLALHLDLKGHNHYYGKNFVQGSGFLGVGSFVSCAGSNVYHAESYSQGAGFFGVGLLVNFEDNNRFFLDFGGQSFALFGSSILWNKQGNSRYTAKQGMAQAASSTLGVAFLIDNQGNNVYRAGTPENKEMLYRGIGQGGSSGIRGDPWLNNPSFYGGLSFLYMGGDGSNYLKTGWLGQGSAYFLGAGIVVAEGSKNTFEADYDAQGQGLHLAAGLLLNKGEKGKFNGGWGSLGVSGDRSVGMFISLGGKNIFEGTIQSIGSSRKPKSLGVFINIGGKNSYQFQKLSSARLQYPQSPKEWSSALFLEVGEGSQYPMGVDEFERGNGRQWGIPQHSLGISTPSLVEDSQTIFSKFHDEPKVDFPFDPILGWSSNVAYQPFVYDNQQAQALVEELLTADYERRRQIYEILDLLRFKDRKIKYELSYFLEHPTTIPEDVFNYAVLWALRNKELVKLQAIKEAISADRFSSEYARKMAVSLAGTFWTPDAVPLLKQVMLHDKSEEIRYYAALSLALNLSANSTEVLEQGLKSNSEVVRFAITKGLQESSNPSALALVTPLFNDESFYVRRAAGLTALSLGDKNGVGVVLDTFQYETLDMDDNYGDNVYNQLAAYLEVDFGLDKQAWINWWNNHAK